MAGSRSLAAGAATNATYLTLKHTVVDAVQAVKTTNARGDVKYPIKPGPRDRTIQCFIRRDKSKRTYHLYLCLSPTVSVENGKFLLSAKRSHRTAYAEYIISIDAENISRSSSSYIGKLRSNLLGTKFTISDTQPPYNGVVAPSSPGRSSCRFYSKKVSPKVPSGSYSIAEVTYELDTEGPRRMHCLMHSIPISSLEPGGTVPGLPVSLIPRTLEDSFRSTAFSKSSLMDCSTDFSSVRFSDIAEGSIVGNDEESKDQPLMLHSKVPRWHEQQQHWCLNFRRRVTVASVKNFQLIAATQPPAGAPTPSQHKVILQFGKVSKDMFTMEYRYPLSAFQAFAICLSSFDTKLACDEKVCT